MGNFEEFVQSSANWDAFLSYKLSGEHLLESEKEILTNYIEKRLYQSEVEAFLACQVFPDPVMKTLNKHNSQKKRTVFTFSESKNIFLKFVAFYLMKYDAHFSENLCSFRQNLCVKTAVKKLISIPQIEAMYCYKADVSDYFASVEPKLLLPQLQAVLSEDPLLFSWIKALLLNPYAEQDGATVTVKKGIMAGVPISAFLANLYLAEMDAYFAKNGVVYVRYSDDIIVFAQTSRQLEEYKLQIAEFLMQKGLGINPKKESYAAPGEKWEFLGFSYLNGVVDVSQTSVNKMKQKMKRKARALVRWKDKKQADSSRAVRAFIRAFNKKLFYGSSEHNITWSRWYFPVINTTESLHILDLYMQDCIRYIARGNYSKARYQLKYEQIKDMGYLSLVNRFYRYKKTGELPMESEKASMS